jgi:SAM-dependent methyltransferase
MDQLRRFHNQKKRELITRVVPHGAYVLDCGCGRGGDLQKWRDVNAVVFGVDPDEDSINEAFSRRDILGMKHRAKFHVGDVFVGEKFGPFDIVCYNFSIHYITDHLRESAKAIARATKRGGLLIGITPDLDRIKMFRSPDALGNTVEPIDDKTISVRLVDGPFYADGARSEPVISKAILESALQPWFECMEWSPMLETPNGLVSDIYSTFIFKRK